MAENLPKDLLITVLTNSVTIAEVLRKNMNLSVILLGGEMSHRGHCHDFYTIQMVKNIRIDKAFLSHTALSLDFGASIHSVCRITDYDLLLTDSNVSADFLMQVKELGVAVETVDVAEV